MADESQALTEITEQEYQDTEVLDEPLNIGALRFKNAEDVIAEAKHLANVLSRIIEEKHLYTEISGRRHVHVTAWSTLGSMIGVVPREVLEYARLYDDGTWQSAVELIRVSDGAVIGRASHLCGGPDDKIWANRSSAQRKSMSVTRATGKAFRLSFAWIITLAGYEATPYEEMVGDEYDNHAPTAAPIPTSPRPFPPAMVKSKLAATINKRPSGTAVRATEKQRGLTRALFNACFADSSTAEKDRYMVSCWILGAGKGSTTSYSAAEAGAIIDWLIDPDNPDSNLPSTIAVKEAQGILRQAMMEQGQSDMFAGQPADS